MSGESRQITTSERNDRFRNTAGLPSNPNGRVEFSCELVGLPLIERLSVLAAVREFEFGPNYTGKSRDHRQGALYVGALHIEFRLSWRKTGAGEQDVTGTLHIATK